MIRRIIFEPEAELDVAEAYRWYEERDEGLGSEFTRSVDGCVYQIQRHSEMYPAVYKEIRQSVIRRFPYSIFYVIEADIVYVVAVFHASRDPQTWQDRV